MNDYLAFFNKYNLLLMKIAEEKHSSFTNFWVLYQRHTLSIYVTKLNYHEKILKTISERLEPVRYEIKKYNKEHAPKFNIFTVLNIHKREVLTHTPFLHHLLSPESSHGQGSLFLDSFIKYVLDKADKVKSSDQGPAIEPTGISKEIRFLGSQIDILLKVNVGNLRFIIIIENKIQAGDQENQLLRYYEIARNLRYSDEEIVLLYLTPLGREPSEISIPKVKREELRRHNVYRALSYNVDISNWLKSALESVGNEKVKCLIEQYISTIEKEIA